MIYVGGMLGIGKTTLVDILHKELNIKKYEEDVKGNKVLPLFYSSSEEEKQLKRYPFLLQMNFLLGKVKILDYALKDENALIDRSVEEDRYFALMNKELGRISSLEMEIYDNFYFQFQSLLKERLKEKKNLFIYLKGNFQLILQRIKKRGRSFEIDDSLISYYQFIFSKYDEYVYSTITDMDILTIEVEKEDFLNYDEDRKRIVGRVKEYFL